MDRVLGLEPVEEFGLWLEALASGYSQLTGPGPSSGLDSVKTNYHFQLEGYIKVLDDLLERCPRIVEEEIKAQPHSLTDLSMEGDWVERVRQHHVLGPLMADFFHLWDFLKRTHALGLSLARHKRLTDKEIKALSWLMADQISEYLQSEGHLFLTRRYQLSKYYLVLHREILAHVELESTREELERIFRHLLKLLSTLSYAQSLLKDSFRYQQLTILLIYARFLSHQFLKLLEETHKYLGYYHPNLAEAVQAVRFALKIESRRIFDQELKGIGSQKGLEAIYTQLETGLGLLRNSVQQSFTSLVYQLNPHFDEFKLFTELRQRREDSARLLTDLKTIYRIAIAEETKKTSKGFHTLMGALRRFERSSMRALYFKDWQPFEQFRREFETAEKRERVFVLHRFEVFVSTLIGEVGKRAILQGVEKADAG